MNGCELRLVRRGRHRAGDLVGRLSLSAKCRAQLEQARRNPSGRAAETWYGDREHVLRQTVIGLASGQRLDEHKNPGEAKVHVLEGGYGSSPAMIPGTVFPVICSSCGRDHTRRCARGRGGPTHLSQTNLTAPRASVRASWSDVSGKALIVQ